MAWIRTIPEDDADGDLKRLYAQLVDPETGRVDNVMKIHSLHPAGLSAHLAVYLAAMTGTTTLPKADREMIGVVVSKINECRYWVVHHTRGLREALGNDELADRVAADFETAGLDDRPLAMLRYAAKLTRAPGRMTRADVDRLRGAGFSDADVLAIAEVTGYYAYANRIVDGLGVELEE